MASKRYNVGILGFGFIGKVHAHGYLNMPFFYDPVPLQARITHVCTSRPETAEAGRSLVDADVATTDYRDITENPDIDIVHICTPNHLHKDALLSAMAHDKHIYCDKPLVSNMAEADEIRAALRTYKGTAQMTLQIRFFPSIMRARQIIDEGRLGRILEYRCCFLHGGSTDPDAPLKWKLSAEAGGGVIADLGSHALDLVQYLAGNYAALSATTKTAYEDRPSVSDPSVRAPVDAEDCVMMLTRMRDGAIGTIEATKLATGTEDEMRIEIHGSEGALRYNQMDPHHLEFYDLHARAEPVGGERGWTTIDTGQRYPGPATQFPGAKLTVGWIRSHMACLANFLQDLVDGKPGNPGLDQGILVQELMEAARLSASEERWVELPAGE